MANLNKVMLMGRLGKDPELNDVGESQVANFTIATNSYWKDKSGQKQEKTEWHNCVAWNHLANLAANFLKKGSQVFVEGSIETETYDKNGETRYATKIKVFKIEFLDSKSSQDDSVYEEPAPVNDQANIRRIQEKFESHNPSPQSQYEQKDDIPF